MKNHKYQILLFLFTISLISSIILSFTPVPEICDINKGCEVIHFSQYNFMFGIQNSVYGIFIFLFMIFLTLNHLKKPTKNKRLLINIGVVIGSLIALRFIYIQEFILNAYCKYCIVVDLSVLLALFVVFSPKKKISFV